MEKIPKVGTIVVVKEGQAGGNRGRAITKVLSKPGHVSDRAAKRTGKRFHHEILPFVMCEAMHNYESPVNCYLNKAAFYDLISDLRPATEEEKALYRKSKIKQHEQEKDE